MTPTMPCFWDGWDPGTVAFCEARLCAVVREPANAWSSAAYLIVAAIMLTRPNQPALVILAQVLIGVGSFFFHASGTFVGEMVDQVGMYMLSCLILAYAVGERRDWSAREVGGVWAATVAGSALLNVVVRPIGIPLFAVQLATGLLLQLSSGGRNAPARYRYMYLGLGIFLGSLLIWTLDITGVVCDPNRHWLNGHAVWHTLNAVSVGLLGRFYGGRTAPRQVGWTAPAS